MDCHEFDINAGWVFGRLYENRKKFDKEFNREFMTALFGAQVLYGQRVYLIFNQDLKLDKYYKRIESDKSEKRGIPNIHYFIWGEHQKHSEHFKHLSLDQFANRFNGEYTKKISKKELQELQKSKDYYSLIFYVNNCVVPKDGLNFGLFFALSLYFTEPEDLNDFFYFQFAQNFAQKKEDFEEYLENIVMKYDFFLKKNHAKKIKKFFLGLKVHKTEIFAQKKDAKKIKIKKSFFAEKNTKSILATLEPYFSGEDFILLKDLIERNIEPPSKLLYTGTKRSFAFFLNYLYSKRMIINSTKFIQIAEWTNQHFLAIVRKKIVEFKVSEVKDILSIPSLVSTKSHYLVTSFESD